VTILDILALVPPFTFVSVAPPPVLALRQAVVALLEADPGLAAIVGARIRPGTIAQGDPLPALYYLVITNPRGHHLRGGDGTAEARMQFDCCSEDLAESLDIKLALERLLDGISQQDISGLRILWAAQIDEHDLHETPDAAGSGETLYRTVVEYRIKHRVSISTP
jgi:hypothetical protein